MPLGKLLMQYPPRLGFFGFSEAGGRFARDLPQAGLKGIIARSRSGAYPAPSPIRLS
jgi:hypothetical protein